MNDKTSDDRAQRAIPAMTGAVNLLNKLLGSGDIKASHKARLRTVLAYITDMQQRESEPAAAQEAVDFYVCDDCGHHYMEDGITCDCSGRSTPGPLRNVRMAPVAAAPVDLTNWAAHYSINPAAVEALQSMLTSTPAAPGIDLAALRDIASDLSQSAKVDDYEPQQIAFIESIRDRLLALIDASPKVFDMLAHLQRQRDFSGRTFGPGTRSAGIVDHIRKELREIEAAPADLSEWIDVVILALDGAWRSGADPQQIIDALVAKQAKNEGRVWPDWRTMPADQAIEHDRSVDSPKGGSDVQSWKLLSAGEVIRRGDQILNDDCATWGELVGWEVGLPYNPTFHVPMRRAQAPSAEVGE